MSSLEDGKLGTPITLQSLALFNLLILMDTLEETLPLSNVHFMKVFPSPA